MSRKVLKETLVSVSFLDAAGNKATDVSDALYGVRDLRRRRNYALQQSINIGEPYFFEVVPGVGTWVVGLENNRMIHGSMVAQEVRLLKSGISDQTIVDVLISKGIASADAEAVYDSLPVFDREAFVAASVKAKEVFYGLSGWQPVLIEEKRRQALQQEQLNRAIHERREQGGGALYAFEKERQLLSNIRAGDRNQARRILNDMLANIYLSSPKLVVLRARSIELMSCLSRAAIEDNPLLEPLIERNHRWTEALLEATSFEDLSLSLMSALDDFCDGIYLHGVNRSNEHVRKALDYIRAEHARALSVSEVARHVGLSESRLSHLVKECTGRTMIQIVRDVRIRQAQHLLERSSMSCSEIAYAVGFSDQSYFIKQFRKTVGRTPARYRQRRFG
ncbi:MAG: helix-turn-helix transcriptional regulator [Kiritimatiellae bacterium]|nr:helix-turn-helix transcriptional regulator [Kiritimatiellia bacterium]